MKQAYSYRMSRPHSLVLVVPHGSCTSPPHLHHDPRFVTLRLVVHTFYHQHRRMGRTQLFLQARRSHGPAMVPQATPSHRESADRLRRVLVDQIIHLRSVHCLRCLEGMAHHAEGSQKLQSLEASKPDSSTSLSNRSKCTWLETDGTWSSCPSARRSPTRPEQFPRFANPNQKAVS